MKWPATVLADLRSAAIRTDDWTVPGIQYATFVSGRACPSKSSRGQTRELAVSPAGAGAVISTSPFKTIESLPRVAGHLI